MAVRKSKEGAALRRWFKEEWRTLSGDKDYSDGDRSFRPTRRVNEDTPVTASELTEAEKAAGRKEKREKGRVSRWRKRRKEKKDN